LEHLRDVVRDEISKKPAERIDVRGGVDWVVGGWFVRAERGDELIENKPAERGREVAAAYAKLLG